MKYGLTLSGGGANFAFHVGAIEAIKDYDNIFFNDVSGVSAGALVGSVCNSPFIMKEIFNELLGRPERVFNPYFTDYQGKLCLSKLINNIGKLKGGRISSLASFNPLKEVINDYILQSNLPPNFFLGLTSVENGNYYTLSQQDFYSFKEFKKALLASCLFFPFFRPIERIETVYETLFECADGGIREVSPVDAMNGHLAGEKEKRTVFTINCRKGRVESSFPKNILQYYSKIDDIKQSEIFRNDIFQLQQANYKSVIIQPEREHEIPSQYDFSKKSMNYMKDLGYEQAIKAIARWEK